jgi:hypothetical protein
MEARKEVNVATQEIEKAWREMLLPPVDPSDAAARKLSKAALSPDEVEAICNKADERISAALPVLERDFLIREAEAKALDSTQDSAQSESSDGLDISEGESVVAARFRASRDILDQCTKARANAVAARSAAEFRLRWGGLCSDIP